MACSTRGAAAPVLSIMGQSLLFTIISYTVLNAPQERVGPFGNQCTLLTHTELTINQNPWIPSCRAALQPLVLQSVHKSTGLHHPRGGIWHFSLLNFTWLVTAQSLNLSRSLYKASLPSRQSMDPPNSVSLASLLCMQSTPVSRTLIKTLKRISPQTERCGTPARCYSTYCNYLSLILPPVVHSSYCVHTQLYAEHFVQKDTVRDSIKSITKVCCS